MAGLKEKLSELEHFAVDVVYDRRKDGRAVMAFAGILRALSWLFTGIVRLRQLLYKNRILRNHHLGCLVVVVGNLTVGGTGKTPVVEKFARALAARGRKVAILSRGYKSKKEPLFKKWLRQITHSEPEPPRIVSNGQDVLLDSYEAGDEPYMLARNLPGVCVLADKNRVKAGLYAIKHFGADTLILDDGFQYLHLKGHTNLLLVDTNNPFGNGKLLPRGILREPLSHIRRATYVMLTKSNGTRDAELMELINANNPGVGIIESRHAPQYLRRVGANTETLELDALQGRKVAAFSGIAVPESFEAFIMDHGAEIRYNQRFMDHHRFSEKELETLFTEAAKEGLDFAVTTEKDAVRLSPDFEPPIPLYYLRLEIEFLGGADAFEQAINRICFPKKSMRATRMPFDIPNQGANIDPKG